MRKQLNYRKILLGLFFIIGIVLVFRIILSYTIITIPYSYNYGKTFIGGTKYKFPINIVNPAKTKKIKDSISTYVELNLVRSPMGNYKRENIKLFKWWWFDRLGKIPDFDIIAINKENNQYCVLVECVDDTNYQCLVFFDKNMENVMQIILKKMN